MRLRPTFTLQAIAIILLFGSAAHASNYSDAVNSYGANLLSYWQFNGAIAAGDTSADSSGQRDGTYGGSVSVGAGIPLAGFGTNQSLNTGTTGGNVTGTADGVSNDLPTGNAARTYAAWINTTNDNGGYRDIFFYGASGFGNAIFTLAPAYGGDSGFTANAFGVSTYNPDVSGSTVINDGAWHMVAFTVTPSSAGMADFALYVDGKLDGSGNVGTTTAAHSNFQMGGDPSGDIYNGLLAQVAVFNTALSGPQIDALYTAAQVPEPATLTLAGVGLLGLWAVARRQRRRRA